ncbi:MAG TPA: hypothetical protein VHY91_01420 [Pirellulales bacterium]|jgi:hypothetical protein|nr:hypothetical protein [Pirellulales bacterium]
MWNFLVDFLVWQPGHIWAVAALFGLLLLAASAAKRRFPQVRNGPFLVAFLAWLAYGFCEYKARADRANIRVDLMLIWPILISLTVIALILSAQSVLRAIRCHRDK